MSNGYIFLWRKTLDTDMMKNHKLFTFWCWCLLKASYKEQDKIIGFKEVVLNPGQFIFGRKKAAQDLRMAESSVRYCLKVLESHQKVSTKATNKYTIVTIIKWDTYQITEYNKNQQIANNSPTNSQQVATYNNINNNNKEIIKEILSYLNLKAKKNFSLDSNIYKTGFRIISERLNEGKLKEQFIEIIDKKCEDKYFKDNRNLLRPETLFTEDNFDKYLYEETAVAVNNNQPKMVYDAKTGRLVEKYD